MSCLILNYSSNLQNEELAKKPTAIVCTFSQSMTESHSSSIVIYSSTLFRFGKVLTQNLALMVFIASLEHRAWGWREERSFLLKPFVLIG